MNTPSLRERLKSPATRAAAKEELRQRILEIVDRKRSLTDMAIWHESAPNYLPWSYMLEEIKALHQEQKLRFETPAPGNLVVHSLSPPPMATETATQADSQPAHNAAAANSKQHSGSAKQANSYAPRPAKPPDERPVTQAQLAELIEQGYTHPQLMETHAYFFFQTGQQEEDGHGIFLANALGAAFVARHGLERAWAMWEAFAGSATILLSEDTQLPWGVLTQITYDHTSSPDSLALILGKLRAGRYAG